MARRAVKGTVSRQLRWVLQYINRRAVVAYHNILILLKDHFKMYKKIQCLNSLTIPDRQDNSRCFKHVPSEYFYYYYLKIVLRYSQGIIILN